MSAPLAKQVLFAAGGDVMAKYGTAIWRKTPPPGGGETAYTFTRSGNGLYLANDVSAGGLRVFTAPANTLRFEQLIDPVSGVLQTYMKNEAAATNSCLQSQTLNTAPWSVIRCTVTQASGTAPDGTATRNILTEDLTAGTHRIEQSITVTAAEFVALSAFVQAGTRTKGNLVAYSTPTVADSIGVNFDLTAGTRSAIATGTGTNSGTAIIALAGGWYWVAAWGKVTTSADVAVLFKLEMCNASNSNNYTGDGASTLSAWGMQLERNGTLRSLAPTSYIVTVAAAAARNTERFDVPYFGSPMGLWVYMRFIEQIGSALADGFPDVFRLGSGAAPWTQFIYGPGAATGYTGRNDPNGPQNDSAIPGGNRPVYGEAVELLLLCNADRTVQIKQTRNQGAEVASNVGAAQASAYPTSYGGTQPILHIGEQGSNMTRMDISRVVVGLQGTGVVSSIADVRNAL